MTRLDPFQRDHGQVGPQQPAVHPGGDHHRLARRDHLELVLQRVDHRPVRRATAVRPRIDPPEGAPHRVGAGKPRHRLIRDVSNGHGFLARQPMVQPHHQHPRLVIEDGHPQPVGGKRQPRHDRVDPVIEQRLPRAVEIDVVHADLGVRMPRPHLPHRAGDDHAMDVADADPAGLGGRPGPGDGLIRVTQQGLRQRQKNLPGLGQPGALRGPIQQPRTQLVLQPLNLPTQRRLRTVQRRGRPTEVPVLGDLGEAPDESQIQIHRRR